MNKDLTSWKHWQLFLIGPLLTAASLFGILLGTVFLLYTYAEYPDSYRDYSPAPVDEHIRKEHIVLALAYLALIVPFFSLQIILVYFQKSIKKLNLLFPAHFSLNLAFRYNLLRHSFTFSFLLVIAFWVHWNLTYLDYEWPRNYDDIGGAVTIGIILLLALYFVILSTEFSIRLHRALESKPYSWLVTIAMILLYPIGVWFLTPKLNKIIHPAQRDITDELL